MLRNSTFKMTTRSTPPLPERKPIVNAPPPYSELTRTLSAKQLPLSSEGTLTSSNVTIVPNHIYFNHQEGIPTIEPEPFFSASNDARALRATLTSFFIDKNIIINTICRRSNDQRQAIQRSYRMNFGRDLIEDLCAETSKPLRLLLAFALTPIEDVNVKVLHDTLKSTKMNDDALVEILCGLSNQEIKSMQETYKRHYGTEFVADVKHTSSSYSFTRLLLALCDGNRDESTEVDLEAAKSDIIHLSQPVGDFNTNMFIEKLCQRSFKHFRTICAYFNEITDGNTLEKAIEANFKNDSSTVTGLIAVLNRAINKVDFFAGILRKYLTETPTNHLHVIRLIVTHCEFDLESIKASIDSKKSQGYDTLKIMIESNSSGLYKKALLAFIGE